MGRSTAAEAEFRTNTVYGLLCEAKSRTEIIQFGAENWKVGERMVDKYIAKARELINQDNALSRPQFLAEALNRLRRIEAAASRRGQLQTACNSIRLQAELIGLTGKSAS